MINNSKKLLFIQSTTPYGSNQAQANYHLMTMGLALDFEMNIIFMEDGVFQLVKHQQSQLINKKNFAKQALALEQYGIKEFYLEKEALEKRGLKQEDLIFPGLLLSLKEISDLIHEHDFIIRL